MKTDTIAAISTPAGNGGISIIRMSGNKVFEILSKMFVNKQNEPLDINNIKGYTINYGYIVNSATKEKIDEVLVSFFLTPKSYTTENMCEINSHGGQIVTRLILEECLRNGARIAEPGEFTKRAFLNGRIDLSQAESIIDIINAKTEKEEKASQKGLQGYLSKEIEDIRKDLLDVMADIEASIDYPEYDEVDITNNHILDMLNKSEDKLVKLENSFNSGKILKDGIKTVIIGRPNAGKSSLLNQILKEERAIVSNIEGTTRDTIEEFVTINGIPLQLIDTAGIRKTKDEIEKIGVEKAKTLTEEAELILAIFDSSEELTEEDQEILNLIQNKKALVLLNKIDISNNNIEINNVDNNYVIRISAKTGEGIPELYSKIEEMFNLNEIENDNSYTVTNIRHKDLISKSIESINEAKESVINGMPVDITSINITNALEHLGEITGNNVTDDILQTIFSKFCLGK